MHSASTIASGVLTLACLLAAVKLHMDCMHHKAEMESGDETNKGKHKSKMRMKYAVMLSTALFGGVFIYQLMNGKSRSSSFLPQSSFLPHSSMEHTESEAEFARRVSEATSKLRAQLRDSPMNAPSMDAPSMYDTPMPQSDTNASQLAARASAEISSFIANNL